MIEHSGRDTKRFAFWGLCGLVALCCVCSISREAHGQTFPDSSSALSLDQLLRMSPLELEALYRRGAATTIPAGRIRGTVLLAPGTRRTRVLSRAARLVWQGKVFEPGEAAAVNRFFGFSVVRAQVYEGPSLLDGLPALILDYSQTSRIYASNRDEVRRIAPDLYLGLMYDRTNAPPALRMYFVLDARQ